MSNTNPSTIHLNDELKFLIACCQTELSEDLALNADTPVVKTKEGCDINFIHSYIQHPTSNIQHLLALANQHGILPLVYRTIKNLPKNDESLSPHSTLLSELKPLYMSIVQRNMLMTSELIKIMDLLKENSIEALAFKGPTLSHMAYGDITLRQYSDLDILVGEKDLYSTAKLIVAQNYEPMDSIAFLKNKAKLHVEKNYEFYGRKNGIKVEIHWRLINSSFLKKFKSYDLFASAQDVKINQMAIPIPDTKILLLYLCNHGASHMWERLEWIVDIDRLIRSKETSLDWNEILSLASTLQSKTSLLLGLGLSKTLFNTPLPPSVRSQLHSTQVTDLITFIFDTLNSDLISKDHTSHKKNLKVFQFHLALQDSLATKSGFILQTLFGYSDRDVMMVNLPRPLFFLYYPLRILRIINKYTFQPLKKLF